MNKTLQRYLAAAGLAIVTLPALATIGTPATAAGSTTQKTVTGSKGSDGLSQMREHRRWVRLMEFDSRRECEWWGRRGENRDWWEDYRCVRDRRWDRRWSDDWNRNWDRDPGSGWHDGHWYDRDYRLWVRFDD